MQDGCGRGRCRHLVRRRDPASRFGFGVGEQGAEPSWLRLAHEPGGEQVACSVVIDCGGLECCPNRLAAEANQLLERVPLGAGGPSDVPFAGYLRVTQGGRSQKKRVDLGAMFPDEPVRRARGSGRLAQRFHLVSLLPLPGLSQLTLGLVARLRELLSREGIQSIGDLAYVHRADSRPRRALPVVVAGGK